MSKSIPAETVRGEGNSAIAPDTGRPLSRVSVMRFAIGFTFFSVLWAMSATMGSSMPVSYTHLTLPTTPYV